MEGSTKKRRQQLEALTDRQCGYFTSQQASELGYNKARHSYHTQNGNWLHPDKGLYRLEGYPDSFESRLTRYSLWSRRQDGVVQVAASHDSALFYYKLLDEAPEKIHFSASPKLRKSVPDEVVLHKLSDKSFAFEIPAIEDGKPAKLSFDKESAADWVKKNGYWISTPLRTLADTKDAEGLKGEKWESCLGKAGARGMISKEEAESLGVDAQRFEGLCKKYEVDKGADGKVVEEFSVQATNAGYVVEIKGEEKEALHPPKPEKKPEAAQKPATAARGGKAASGAAADKGEVDDAALSPVVFGDSHNKSAFFTLVEVLVGMTLVIGLAAVLMPALQKSMKSSHMTQCVANLKQIGMAYSRYLNDFDDVLPYHWKDGVSWDSRILKYMGENDELMLCPADETGGTRTYSQNNFVQRHHSPWNVDRKSWLKQSAIARPGQMVLLGEKPSSENWIRASKMADFWPGDVATYACHRGSMNFLFCDMHVSWLAYTTADDNFYIKP